MANIKISQLTPKGANLGASDLLEISEFNGSGYETKSITGQEIIDAVGGGAAWGDITGTLSNQTDLQNELNNKQDTLVSGTNIKTINGSSVLGSGDLTVGGSLPLALEYNDSNRTIWSNGKGDVGTNTSFGEFSLNAMSTGNYNTAFGAYSLATNQIRSENTSFGYSTLRYGLNPQQNAAFGAYALQSSTGVGNTGVGMWAGIGLTSGNYNTLIGKFCGRTMQGVSNITGVGSNALENNTSGTSLTAVGYYALKANTSGADNTAIGYASLIQSTTASGNTSIGSNAMYSTLTGYQNTALGTNALYNITSGYNNVGIGWGAGPIQATASESVGIGYYTQSNTGSIVIGSNASSYNGTHCVVLGRGAEATANNQFVVGSTTYEAGSVSTESNSSTKVWNVIINGVAQKILLA